MNNMSKNGIKIDLIQETELELIKDYLKTKGFESTYSCLVKEEKYKNVVMKNTKVSNDKILKMFLLINYE